MAVQTFNDRPFDSAVFAAESLLPEENSFTILSSDLMLKGEYMRDGDDLIIRGDMGEEIRVEEYFSGDNPPTLETPYGAIVLPETVQKLLVNSDSIDVAGPAGSLSIPGLLGDPIGTIDELGGDGQATAKGADGVVRALNEGDPIYQDDVIETVGRSFANLRMMDDTSFQLGKETRAIIENYNYTPGVESGSFEATVISGFFRYASGKLGGLDKGTHTTIKTPTAQIGVRGSEMEGIIEEDGSSTFVHKNGILDVSDANGRGTVTLDEPGMATAVSSKPGAPASAFEAPESLLKSFEEALPPPPDFVVSHDEEGDAEGEVELLDMAALGEGEAGEEGVEGVADELVVPVIEVMEVEEAPKAEDVQQNAVPIAFNDLLFSAEDKVITGSLAINDSLGDGKHTWSVAEGPLHGTLEISPDGSFTYTPEANYHGSDAFSYTMRDADGDESTAQVFINLDAVNDQPEVIIDGILVYKESDVVGGQGTLSVQEVDGDQIQSATVTINDALASDRLVFDQPGSGISGSYSFANGVGTLTLTGDATLEAYQSALLAVVFGSDSGDPTQNGITPDRSITWSITDVTGLSSTPVTSTVSITPVNNMPVATPEGATASLTYTEGELGSQPLFAGLQIAPVESGQTITQLVFAVDNVADGAFEKLIIDGVEIPLIATTTPQSIGSDINYEVSTTGVVTVTLTGQWDSARASQLVGGVKYKNASLDPSVDVDRVITLQSIQDSGGTANGGADTFTNTNISTTVTVEAANTPPTITLTGDLASEIPFAEGAAAVDLFPAADVQFAISAIEEGQKLNKLVLRIENAVPDDQLMIEGATIDAYTDAPGLVTVAAANGLPQYEYGVSVVSGTTAKTVDVTLVGDWTAAEVESLINALQYQNEGNDPAAWDHEQRIVSLYSLSDDGSTPTDSADPTGSMADDATNLLSGLSRTVAITPNNDLPASQGGGAQLVDFKGSTALSLFSGVTVSPTEHSQTINQITLSVTALSGDAGEKLTINGVEISLVPTTETTASGLTYQISESIVSEVDPKGKTTIILTGAWDSDAASALVNGITYSNSVDLILADSRIIRLEEMMDSKGGSAPFSNNVLAEVRSPLNQPPELKVVSGDPATDVLFVEDATGGGTAVQVFSGLTFEATAGLNEDPVQKLRLLEFEIQGLATDDYLVIGGKEIMLSGANKTSVTDQSSGPAFDYTIVKTYDGDGQHNGWKVTLEGSWTRDSSSNTDEVNELLQGVYFKNSGNDPAPVGGSAERIFTITKIWDAGDDLATTVDETGKDETLNIVRQVVIDPYNQSPSLVVESTVGSSTAPAVYTVSGVEVGLFSVEATDGSSSLIQSAAVEASQSITTLKFTVDGVGGILSGQDGSKEWITIDGSKILLSTTAGDVTADWSGANSTAAENYSVTASGVYSREITLNGSWSPAELDALIEGMSFGLAYADNGQIQGSGVRTVTLTEMKDDGGVEIGATNDTVALNVGAVVEVMVAADGGVSIVNKNYEVVGPNLSSLTTAEQYFEYSEVGSNAALLGGADSFEVNFRLNGAGMDQLLPGIAFDLFEYKTAAGWVKLRIKSDGNLDLVFEKGSTEVTTSVTDTPLLSSTELSDILLDGQAHDLKLTWDYGSNATPGDFNFYLDNATTPTTTVSDTQLISGADSFLEGGGTITVGAPSFSGTIYDISIKSTAGGEVRETHWNMDQVDAGTVQNILDSSQYSLSIVNTTLTDTDSANDNAVEVDTFLVTEDIDIPELKYLVDNHAFDQVTNLQLNLSGNGAEAQVLNGQDLLDLKAGGTTAPEIDTVRVFGDAEDSLTLGTGWIEQTTAAGGPKHYIFTSGADQIDLYVESVAVQLTT